MSIALPSPLSLPAASPSLDETIKDGAIQLWNIDCNLDRRCLVLFRLEGEPRWALHCPTGSRSRFRIFSDWCKVQATRSGRFLVISQRTSFRCLAI